MCLSVTAGAATSTPFARHWLTAAVHRDPCCVYCDACYMCANVLLLVCAMCIIRIPQVICAVDFVSNPSAGGGANVDDGEGDSALMFAAERGELQVAENDASIIMFPCVKATIDVFPSVTAADGGAAARERRGRPRSQPGRQHGTALRGRFRPQIRVRRAHVRRGS